MIFSWYLQFKISTSKRTFLEIVGAESSTMHIFSHKSQFLIKLHLRFQVTIYQANTCWMLKLKTLDVVLLSLMLILNVYLQAK